MRLRLSRHLLLRRACLVLLALALVVYGWSGVLQQVMGSMHRHDPQPQPAEVVRQVSPGWLAHSRLADAFRGLRAWRDEMQMRSIAGGGFAPSHAHAHKHGQGPDHAHDRGRDAFERHHHKVGDASVVALDAGASNAQQADGAESGASTSLPLALASQPRQTASPTVACRWLAADVHRWANAEGRRLERPPQV